MSVYADLVARHGDQLTAATAWLAHHMGEPVLYDQKEWRLVSLRGSWAVLENDTDTRQVDAVRLYKRLSDNDMEH